MKTLLSFVPFAYVGVIVLLMSIDNGYKTEYLYHALAVVGFMMLWQIWIKSHE